MMLAESLLKGRFWVLMNLAWSSGPPELQWLTPQSPCIPAAAARAGNVAVLSELAHNGYAYSCWSLQEAAAGGHIPAMQFFRASGCGWSMDACYEAAVNGHLEALQWLWQQGCPWNERIIGKGAAESGSLELVRWLQQQRGIVFTQQALCSAAEHGPLELCKYLHEDLGKAPFAWVAAAAAAGGQQDTLRWLLAQVCPVDEVLMCKGAAQSGNIELMAEYWQQVQQSGSHDEYWQAVILTDMLNAAGAHGYLEAAQWCVQRGAEWPEQLQCFLDDSYLRTAVWSGAVLQWARALGCTSPSEEDEHDSDTESYYSADYDYDYDDDYYDYDGY
jgi:hypothetical protein